MPKPLDALFVSATPTVVWSNFATVLFIALFLLVIILLLSGKKTRKIAAGTLAIVLVFAGMWLVSVKRTMRPPGGASARAIQTPSHSTQVHYQQFDGLLWPAEGNMSSEELFFASPYKFRGAAIRRLARQCSEYLLEQNLADVTTLSIGSIVIPPEEINGTVENQLLSDRREFINELTRQLPPHIGISEHRNQELSEQEMSILLGFATLQHERDYAHFPADAPLYRNGMYTAEVFAHSEKSNRFRTQFRQLEWVTNFSNFNQNRNNEFLHVAAEWKPTNLAAKQNAINAAAKALAPMLHEQVEKTLSSNRWGQTSVSLGDLERRLVERMRQAGNSSQENPIVDRFTQIRTLDDGTGSFREELLLYPRGFEPIISDLLVENQRQKRSVRFRFFSMFGLVGVVLLTYFSANAVTRGYAVMSIGAICLGLLVGGMVLIAFVS